MKTYQKGFGVIEILAATLIIGLLGTVIWLAYDKQRDKADEKSVVSQKSLDNEDKITKKDESTSNVAPEGYTSYANKDLGFSFYYPAEWGAVRTTTPSSNDTILFSGNFDNMPAISFALSPKVVAQSQSFTDPACYTNGFSTFEFLPIDNSIQNTYSKELAKSTDRQVVESYKNGYCSGPKLQGRVHLKLAKSNGIDITYFTQTDPQYAGSETVSAIDYMKSHKIDEGTISNFTKTVNSIKSL